MFNQSNPRVWFAGFVLSGLFSIESIDPEGWRLGGHWHVASRFLSRGLVFIASETGFPPSDTGVGSLRARRRGTGHGGSSGVLGSENLF